MSLTIKDGNYQKEQSRLLVKIVPYLHEFSYFVFHGGTVINLFYSDKFKRYSVDLDGVFVPNKNEQNLSDSQLYFLINKKLRNNLNKNYSIKYPERHKYLMHDFVNRFPFKSDKSKSLYRAYQNYIEKQIKIPSKIHFSIPKSMGR